MLTLMNSDEKRSFLLRYAVNRQASESPDQPHWITIHGKDGKGVHILINKAGMVLKGPDGMKGKSMNSLSQSSERLPKAAPLRKNSLFDKLDERSFGPSPAETEPAQTAKTPGELVREIHELRTNIFGKQARDNWKHANKIADDLRGKIGNNDKAAQNRDGTTTDRRYNSSGRAFPFEISGSNEESYYDNDDKWEAQSARKKYREAIEQLSGRQKEMAIHPVLPENPEELRKRMNYRQKETKDEVIQYLNDAGIDDVDEDIDLDMMKTLILIF